MKHFLWQLGHKIRIVSRPSTPVPNVMHVKLVWMFCFIFQFEKKIKMNACCRIFQSVLISNLAEIKDYKTTTYWFFYLKLEPILQIFYFLGQIYKSVLKNALVKIMLGQIVKTLQQGSEYRLPNYWIHLNIWLLPIWYIDRVW